MFKPLLISLLLLIAMFTIGCGTNPPNNIFTYHEAPDCNTLTKVIKKKCDDGGFNNSRPLGLKCDFETEHGPVNLVNENEVNEGDVVCVYTE